MGWRLATWGRQDLEDTSEYVIYGPLGRATHGLFNLSKKWRLIPSYLDRTSERIAAKITRVEAVLNSNTGLLDDGTWFSRRPVGAGGFGVAALFEKINNLAEVVDVIVIKTAKVRYDMAISKKHWTVPKEARIMSQLNQVDNEAILYMRALKTMVVRSGEGPRIEIDGAVWRYYLEAAPHGDLERLRIRYKAWGRYLPEPFLWHIFKGLMEAAKTMETGPFEYLDKFGKRFDSSYIVHCDIKPENIFLGREKQKDGPTSEFYYFPNYPMPKMADFGLAELTTYGDADNHPGGFTSGTPGYYAPEVRMEKLLDWDKWQFSPFNRAPRESYRTRIDPPHAQHRVTAAANIWAIGMVMYQLVTLDEPHEVDNMVKQMNENRLRSQRGRVVRSAGTMRHPDYDENLLELVLDCLRLTPEERPTPEKALQTIDGWLKNHQENVQMDRTMQDGEKVFYKANEINYMSPGGFNFGITDKWWKGYFNRDEIWLDENWGKLKPPGRPEYLDPWRVDKRSRGAEDDYVGPATALQRENYRVKRRKTDTDGDVYDTEAETLVMSQTVALNRGRGGVFSNGCQIVQRPVNNSDQAALNLLQLQTRSPAQQGGFQQQQGRLSQQQSGYPYGFTRLQVGNPGGGYIRRDSAHTKAEAQPISDTIAS